jgi:hypothetical protein
MLSVLLEGPQGSGKTALAATAAIESAFPFAKVVSPEAMVGYSEQAKASQIAKVFEDAYKSPLSVVILVRMAGGGGGGQGGGHAPCACFTLFTGGSTAVCQLGPWMTTYRWQRATPALHEVEYMSAPLQPHTLPSTHSHTLPPPPLHHRNTIPPAQDDIERLLEYVAIGPRFSNTVLQVRGWGA